jgi:beta-mannan synthase
MQIVRKSMVNIFKSKDIGFFAKINCYWFFARYSLFAIVTFAALLAPPIVLWLDPWVWTWYTIWFIVSANIATVVYLYFTWFSYIYMLFAVVLGYFKAWAMFSGIAGLKKSKSWKVTLKFACNNNLQLFRNYHKPYFLEFVLGAYYLTMVGFAMWYQQWVIAGYSGLMAFAFIFVSFGDYFL